METPAEMNMLESMISLMMRTQVKYLPIVTETLPSDKSFVIVNLKVCRPHFSQTACLICQSHQRTTSQNQKFLPRLHKGTVRIRVPCHCESIWTGWTQPLRNAGNSGIDLIIAIADTVAYTKISQGIYPFAVSEQKFSPRLHKGTGYHAIPNQFGQVELNDGAKNIAKLDKSPKSRPKVYFCSHGAWVGQEKCLRNQSLGNK